METTEDTHSRMQEFPCAFNLRHVDKITTTKLKTVKHNLLADTDICNLESEQIRNNNLLTWIYFRLDKQDEAIELSNELVELTRLKNISSLGNRFFVLWNRGYELEAKKCLELLVKIKDEDNFCDLLIEAKAEQAYYYSRLGGPLYLKLAIDLFSEAVAEKPDNYLWKFGLGLVYRRATHANIFCSSSDRMDVETYMKMAVKYLLDVADNGHSALQAMAYSQLAHLRQNCPPKLYREYDALFRHLSIEKLCDKALEKGSEMPSVLTQCGKAIRPFNVEKSICWLEKSVQLSEKSMAYHYLGKSYVRKAEIVAKRNRSEQFRTVSMTRRKSFNEPANIRAARRQSYTEPREASGTLRQSYYDPAEVYGTYRQSYNEPANILGTRRQSYTEPRETSGTLRQSYYDPTEIGGTDRHSYNEPAKISGTFGESCYEPRETGGTRRLSYNEPTEMSEPQVQLSWKGNFEDSDHTQEPHTHVSTFSPTSPGYMYGSQHGQKYPSKKWTHEESWDSRGGGRDYGRRNIFVRSASYNSAETTFECRPENARESYIYCQGAGRSTDHESGGREEGVTYRGRERPFGSSFSESWSPQGALSAYVRKGNNCVFLNKDDELVQKAVECFNRSIKIAKENFPAILDLGILLKKTGQLKEALTQFNIVTNSHLSSTYHRVTVISAYEHAGLCYLELSKTTKSNKQFEEMGKKKLTKAVSLAADLAVNMPDLKDNAQELWTAFRTLENAIDRESPSPNQQKKKIKLLELAKDHAQIIDVLQKLRDYSEDELNDPDIIMIALQSYLNLSQPDNALAFQNLVAIRPAVRDSTWWTTSPVRDLRVKVLLQAAFGHLKDSTENPIVSFQQLFELSFGACFGLCAHEHEQTNSMGDIVADDLTGNFIGDVLFVYDGDYDSEVSPNPTMKAARCLKEVFTRLFGLEAEENLKGTGEFGDFQSEIQLMVMKKYLVVIIMMGSEIRERGFDAVLKCLSCSGTPTDPSHQRIVIIDAGLQDRQVPLCLKQYKCFKLEDIGGLGEIEHVPGFRDDDGQLSFEGILNHVFHGDVDAVLKLFCFMIGQEWPCP